MTSEIEAFCTSIIKRVDLHYSEYCKIHKHELLYQFNRSSESVDFLLMHSMNPMKNALQSFNSPVKYPAAKPMYAYFCSAMNPMIVFMHEILSGH